MLLIVYNFIIIIINIIIIAFAFALLHFAHLEAQRRELISLCLNFMKINQFAWKEACFFFIFIFSCVYL